MITQVQLANFRSHKLTNMALAPFTVVLGPMGVGKTSLLHAISLILCGQNPLVNAKSEGLRREVRLGENEFHIGLRLDDGTVIDRKVTEVKHSVGLNGNYADVKIQAGKILGKLGIEFPDVVLCLLDPTRFFSRDEKTQRKVLMTFMAAKGIEIPELVKRLGLAQSFSGVGQIDELIKEIKEQKIRDLNRDIKTLNAQIPAPVEFQPRQKAALEMRLGELNAKRDAILKHQARDEEWVKLNEALARRLAGLPVPDPSVSIESLEKEEAGQRQKLLTIREQYGELFKKHAGFKTQRDSSQQEVGRLLAVERTLEGLGKQCPTCQRELKKEDKQKLIQFLSTQRLTAEDLVKTAQRDMDKIGLELTELEKTGKAQQAHVEAVAGNRLALSSRLSTYQEAKKAVDEHQAAKPKESNWPVELAAVAGDIAAANIDLLAEQEKESTASRREIQVASVRSKESEAEKLDSAAKELATLKDKILNESSGGFIESMQDFVDKFNLVVPKGSEYELAEVQFSLDPFGFSVGGIYADQISGGQKIILEVALRQAAAKASGLNIFSVDDANMLTDSVRQKLAGVLMNDSVQCIVCSMTEKEPVIGAPLPKNVKMYWLTSPSLIGPTTVKPLGVGSAVTA